MPFLRLPSLQSKHQGFSLVWFLLILALLVGGLCMVEAVLPASALAVEFPDGSVRVSRRLLKPTPLRPVEASTVLSVPRGIINVDDEGFILSTNPVWNACIRKETLLPGFLRSNKDVFTHRQGKVQKQIPFTCRDYHRGNENVWKHPDFLDAEVYVDAKGKLLGVLTAGFIVQRLL